LPQPSVWASPAASVSASLSAPCESCSAWPAAPLVLGGYGAALLLALGAPAAVSGVAFDAGAAATSAINIPLIMALGVGTASVIRGRNPIGDGFGLVALASVMPMIAVLLGAYALLPLR
jgi:hypothetical protein